MQCSRGGEFNSHVVNWIWEVWGEWIGIYTVLYYTVLYCTVLLSTIYRCSLRLYITINISIRYGSERVTFCCSYIFCHKMVTNGKILEFEVSIEPCWALLLDTSIKMTIQILCFSEIQKYIFCHKMVTYGRILEFEVSVKLYWGLLLHDSMWNDNTNPVFLLGKEIYILP